MNASIRTFHDIAEDAAAIRREIEARLTTGAGSPDAELLSEFLIRAEMIVMMCEVHGA